MSRPRRIAVVALAAIFVVVLIATATAVAIVRRSYPVVDGESRLLGLEADAEVLRDVDGVPHIYASTPHDLFFLQGYVTASDRLWELEFLRRVGQARLSELFGPGTLDADKFLRVLGLYRSALRDVDVLGAETRAVLAAYAEGVNKYVELHRSAPPIEFVLLGVTWEPWRPADTAVIGKIMAWDLGGNMSSELLRADVDARLGPEAARALFPGVPVSTPPILLSSSGDGLRSPGAEQVRALLGSGDPSGLGSNNWVVAGSRTATGRPLLANDVHLGVRNPSIWYLVHLVGAGYDVTGFSIPGAPGVVVGHNARIAWGVTNVGPDVQDLFVEQPNPSDLRQFRFEDGFAGASVRREEIRVRGQEPLSLDVVESRHGPVLTPVLEGTKQLVALRWTALDPGHILDALVKLDRAASWDEFRTALRDWDVPAQHFVYADVDGHIGYQLAGRIPIRARGDGHAPVPGWTGEYEWTGSVPFEELPSRFDPPEGVIVTANQRPLPTGRHFLGDEWDPGFRAQRIHDLLRGKDRLMREDFTRIQLDTRDIAAERFLSFLRSVNAHGPESAAALARLREWDGTMRADSVPAAIYQAWLRHMFERTFKDKLGPLYPRYVDASRTATIALYELAGAPDSPWFVELGGQGLRGRDEIAALALDDAVRDLSRALGPDQRGWTWGRLHTISFTHPLGKLRPLDRVFDIGPYQNGGDGFTVAQAGYSLKGASFAQTDSGKSHVSMRLIVDLGDLDASLAVLSVGQSGQPFAPHWGDMAKKWLEGTYVPLRYSRGGLGQLEGRLLFRPR